MRRHDPPQPFGPLNSKKGKGRQPLNTRGHSQTEWCLLHPPSNTPVPEDRPTRSLTLLEDLTDPHSQGAKVFRCFMDGNDCQTFVAKIYDPLYYEYTCDVCYYAEKDYSVETASYEDIQEAGLDGKYTPKYYGSWAINIPFSTSPPVERTVCLVIMEDLKGPTMSSLLREQLASRIPPAQRLEILGDAFEIGQRLEFWAGVRHEDITPRNIILEDLDLRRNMPPRVVVFDFNVARCFRRPNSKENSSYNPGTRPDNPLHIYWTSSPSMSYGTWIPEPHVSNGAAWRGWLVTRWGDSTEFMDKEEALEHFIWSPENDSDPVVFVEPYPDPVPQDY
jgi:hypothetical protein